MYVYRIEDERDREYGPFNPKPASPLAQLLGLAPRIEPVMQADIVAKVTKARVLPHDMPGPQNDGIDFDRYSWDDHDAYHSGFADLKQYHRWFTNRLTRAALFTDTHMVLRQYEVPDADVKIGRHQVMFRFDHARLAHTYSFEEAIK